MKQEVTVFAPATVANVACGFDIMGFAINQPGDIIIARRKPTPGLIIERISGDNGKLPKDVTENTAGIAASALLKDLNEHSGISLEIEKKMPLGSGLGSSAASAAGAVYAVNHLLGEPLATKELLPYVIEAEAAISGNVHADNAAPALLGGFILIRGYDPVDVISLNIPDNLFCALIHPHSEIRTREARQLLPKEIPLRTAIKQWGNVGGLVAGLLSNDMQLISRSLQDNIAEPIRSKLIPGFTEIKNAALQAGALGASISGSGPSIFAFCEGEAIAKVVANEMQQACRNTGTDSTIYVSPINRNGPKVLTTITD